VESFGLADLKAVIIAAGFDEYRFEGWPIVPRDTGNTVEVLLNKNADTFRL
jgi:hypothetical protein